MREEGHGSDRSICPRGATIESRRRPSPESWRGRDQPVERLDRQTETCSTRIRGAVQGARRALLSEWNGIIAARAARMRPRNRSGISAPLADPHPVARRLTLNRLGRTRIGGLRGCREGSAAPPGVSFELRRTIDGPYVSHPCPPEARGIRHDRTPPASRHADRITVWE